MKRLGTRNTSMKDISLRVVIELCAVHWWQLRVRVHAAFRCSQRALSLALVQHDSVSLEVFSLYYRSKAGGPGQSRTPAAIQPRTATR